MAARRIEDFAGSSSGGRRRIAVRHEAFAEAYRHSARVKRLRIIVPTLAAGASVLIIGAIIVGRLVTFALPFSLDGLSLQGSKLTMDAPRLAGFTEDNRSYRLSARRAEQDVANPAVVDLEAVHAELELEGGGLARLESRRGILYTRENRITLADVIDVSTTTGYKGQTTKADIDTRAGTMVADAPVTLSSPGGRMVADRMEIRDRGKVFIFEGNVEGDFLPSPPEPRAPIVPDTNSPEGGVATSPAQPPATVQR